MSAVKFLEELKDSLDIVREGVRCLQFNQVGPGYSEGGGPVSPV